MKQASLDSVHEKNVRHGHISTLHIWPARRPLAACRAALIATLLSDPGSPEARKRLLERIGGVVVKKLEHKKLGGKTLPVEREETVGGILHWGRESSTDLEWFRQEIRNAYGGRAPRVLDPFAGGGAIPLEAMRLGCEVTAVDINPVAWFILRGTLEYPQRLAGQKRALPGFVLADRRFMEAYLTSRGLRGATLRGLLDELDMDEPWRLSLTGFGFDPALLEVDLAWHVRAWGLWVLQRAKQELGRFYPTIDEKPTVAYLWARTVTCKNCRATIPLLKTRWLCKKDKKRVLLTMKPMSDRSKVIFGVESNVPPARGNAAQKREHDKRLGQGTMSRSGAWCPCCGEPGTVAMEMEDIRQEGLAGRLGSVMTAVVVDGKKGKEYRVPTEVEVRMADEAARNLDSVFAGIPSGLPVEAAPKGGGGASRAFSVDGYGLDIWSKLFTDRQLLALGTFAGLIRECRKALLDYGYPAPWQEGLQAYLAAMFDRLANQSSTVAHWNSGGENIEGTFARFALPIIWDFAEVNPLGDTSGGFASAVDWVALAVDHFTSAARGAAPPNVLVESAINLGAGEIDLILTDPPYYDAIPYSDLMDFFHVWLRRVMHGVSDEYDRAFREPLGPKWRPDQSDGELVDDSSRHGGDKTRSKAVYEDGMFRAVQKARSALTPSGRIVIVFANKNPDAWEALVSAVIRAGFVVDGSWPIQTERSARTRSIASAALASSVWLVCKKRPDASKPGWDNRVLEEMRENIGLRLREFWDAGIRGPDFVWAATGPALEAYSKHPVVKMADDPGRHMDVPEFLRAVRRIVVDFVVGRALSHDGEDAAVAGLDDVTTYYVLHRSDFGLAEVPIGPCILYAVSCGLSDRALADDYDVLIRTGGRADDEDEEESGEDDEAEKGGGSRVRLKSWDKRARESLGLEAGGRPAPMIDQVHRLMRLWKLADVAKVDEYLDTRALRKSELFHRLLQALIELAPQGSEEESILERISNHVRARTVERGEEPPRMPFEEEAATP